VDRYAAASLLRELASSDDVAVRGWVTGVAALELDRVAAVAVLESLAGDEDADVRSEALRELVSLDPSWSTRAVAGYRAEMRRSDVLAAVNAIWRLVQLREHPALGEIEELARSSDQPLLRNNASVAALVLRGDESALLAALERHEHRRTALWLRGLAYLATPGAIRTIERYAQDAPDKECRRRAQDILRKLAQVRPITRK